MVDYKKDTRSTDGRTNESWETDTRERETMDRPANSFKSPNNQDYSGKAYKAKPGSNMDQRDEINESDFHYGSQFDINKKSDHKTL